MKSWRCCAAIRRNDSRGFQCPFDITTNDPVWSAWSIARLTDALLAGPVLINDIIYAEFSTRYSHIEEVEEAIALVGLSYDPIPREALFLAGKAFQTYRQRGGTRTGVLPDFFIGAHAVVRGWALLTRDARRYRGYFPTLSLITPA